MNKEKILSFFSIYSTQMLVLGCFFIFVFVTFLLVHTTDEVYSVGATYTVCATGCNYTTITDALAAEALVSGDTIQVQASYSSAGETFPLTFADNNITVDCNSSGAVIGTAGAQKTVQFSSGSTIQNCSFNNVVLQDNGADTPGVSINNNTFSTSTYSNIVFSDGSDGSTIDNNTGLTGITAGADTLTITDNTIQVYVTSTNFGSGIIAQASSGHTITGNIIESYFTNYVQLFNAETGISNSTISSNSFEYKVSPVNAQFGLKPIWLKISTSTTFSNNYIILPATTQTGGLVSVGGGEPGQINDLSITNNTFVFTEDDDTNNDLTGIIISRAASGSDTINIGYNIFVNKSANTEGKGIIASTGSAGSITITEEYNGFYNLGFNYSTSEQDGVAIAATSKITDPYFMTDDVATSNDYHLAPFSPYLDVNGTADIGAYNSIARGTSFAIDDDGTIDYSTVHATSTSIFGSVLRTGDTVTIAAGSYDPITLSSNALLSSGITVTGAGASTIIDGSSSASALSLSGISSSNFSNFVVQNASSTSQNYAISSIAYDYGVNTYDIGGSGVFFFLYDDCDVGMLEVSADNTDITAYTNTSNWNLALMNFTENESTYYITGIVRDDTFPDSASVGSACAGFIIDTFVNDVFSYNALDRSFTYNSAAVTAASITLSDGYTNPPAITKTDLSYEYGIKLNNSNGNTFSSVTSTGNTYGIYFTGTSASNNFNDSVIQSSTSYDILSDSSGNNNIKNSSFDSSKASITGSGDANIYYKVRAQVSNTASSGIGGVGVTISSSDSSQTASLSTDGTGTTTYSGYLFAHIMDSVSTSTSNGGYNPYTISATATSTYVASSTTFTLDSKNESVTLSMLSTPIAPSNLSVAGGIGAGTTESEIPLSWNDNSSGYAQENNFLLDYIEVGDSFPGTTTTVGQNSTSVTVTDLAPNMQYQFRIAAVNAQGTSSYSTSDGQYTAAAIPATVVSSQNGQTSLIVSWSANSNSSGTVYELYNVTTAASVTSTVTSTSHTVTGLTAGTSYQFKVRAQYLSDNSTWTTYSSNSTAVATAAVSDSVAMTLGVAASSTFQFTDNESHTATLNSVDLVLNTANFTIESNSVTQNFTLNTPDNIDSDGNGVDDMTVTLTDLSANNATITLASYTPPASSNNNNSSSGSGSPVAPSVPQSPMVSAPVTQNILVTQDLPVVVSVGNSLHTVTMTAMNSDGSITIIIQSDPITLTLKPGEEKIIDTDRDGIEDIFIKYGNKSGVGVNLTVSSIDDLEFTIDKALSTTETREVTLNFNSPQTVMMAISNEPTFAGVSFESYARTKHWTLTPGNGIKTVYTKFRTAQGGTKTVTDTISLGVIQQTLEIPSKNSEDLKPDLHQQTDTPTINERFARLLSLGSRGDDVKELQMLLKKLSYFRYPKITGYFGTITRSALQLFQKSKNIDETGVVDDNTKDVLNKEYPVDAVLEDIKPVHTFSTFLNYGMKSEEVKYLQIRLQELGYFPQDVEPNGVFGPVTRLSVTKLQTEHSLTPAVGYVGPGTRAVLNEI